MHATGFQLALRTHEERIVAVAGFRIYENFHSGRLMYVDDLVTDGRVRSRGYGKEMLDWLKAEARDQGCSELQLISRVTREQAHRFYFREGMAIECFEFRMKL